MQLFERESEQDQLAAGLADARRKGRIVLVSGPAGIGKTSLVASFVDKHRLDARVLWGASDPLFTPRPLGPLYDIASAALPDLAGMLNSGASWLTIAAALLEMLQQGTLPWILVLEDIHWADEATLDLIQYVGRRIPSSHTLLTLTYRDDEMDQQHHLQSILGNLPAAHTTRLQLQPLSEPAVARLAQSSGRSATGLYAATRGNPFFVTEVLKDETNHIPTTVRDAVLTRVARLPSAARAILEFVSVSPSPVERDLVESTLHPEAAFFDACFEGGFLVLSGRAIAFRHELARLVVLESLPPGR